jgi:hypothetical protein
MPTSTAGPLASAWAISPLRADSAQAFYFFRAEEPRSRRVISAGRPRSSARFFVVHEFPEICRLVVSAACRQIGAILSEQSGKTLLEIGAIDLDRLF